MCRGGNRMHILIRLWMLCLAKILEDFLRCVSKALENCPFRRVSQTFLDLGSLDLNWFFISFYWVKVLCPSVFWDYNHISSRKIIVRVIYVRLYSVANAQEVMLKQCYPSHKNFSCSRASLSSGLKEAALARGWWEIIFGITLCGSL